jgi:hypothetical protein
MLEDLNAQITEIRLKLRARDRLRGQAARVQQSLASENDRRLRLEAELAKEEHDLEKLDGLSLTALFHAVLGNKEIQSKKERQEHLAAKLRYDECREAIAALDQEMRDLNQQIAALGNLDAQYQSIMTAKEKAISSTGDETASRLAQLTEDLADAESDLQECREAMIAGAEAAHALQDVVRGLRGASSWGAWDLLGGGVFATALKHSRIDGARSSAHRAQQSLRRFQRELADVRPGAMPSVGIDIGSFTTFADYFFDGLITDWIVQSRIHSSLNGAAAALDRVQRTIGALRGSLRAGEQRAAKLKQQRDQLIESA